MNLYCLVRIFSQKNTEEQMNGADEHGRIDWTEQKAQRPKGRGMAQKLTP